MMRTIFILLSIAIFSSAASGKEGIEDVCPLTKKYMLENLHSLKAIIDSNKHSYPKKYHEHMLRMAGEVLKIEDFVELKSEIKK